MAGVYYDAGIIRTRFVMEFFLKVALRASFCLPERVVWDAAIAGMGWDGMGRGSKG